MIRTPTSWSDKTLMWLLVCLVAIATLDDFGSIAMASPSSELFIVAEDDDPDDSAERPPICAAGGVGHTDIRWFARSATEITGPAERRNGLVLRYGPRGPPLTDRINTDAKGHFCLWSHRPRFIHRVQFPSQGHRITHRSKSKR